MRQFEINVTVKKPPMYIENNNIVPRVTKDSAL